MSCEENTKILEAAYERAQEKFFEALEDYDFQCLIYSELLSYQEQWLEKEYGFDENPYLNIFDHLWNADCDAMIDDPKAFTEWYCKEHGHFAIQRKRKEYLHELA